MFIFLFIINLIMLSFIYTMFIIFFIINFIFLIVSNFVLILKIVIIFKYAHINLSICFY